MRISDWSSDVCSSDLMMITHDLGVIAQSVGRVVVMYAGRKVEEAPVKALFRQPRHPYTAGLLGSVPKIQRHGPSATGARLTEIPGIVPALDQVRTGCSFAPRCPLASRQCHEQEPELEVKAEGPRSACWTADRALEAGHSLDDRCPARPAPPR